MKKLLSKTAIFLCFFGSVANAKDVTINDALSEILKNSNAKKSSEYALKASEGEASKAQKYWLPTLYIDSSAYETNDPTKTFMGNLYQRSIRASDFDPNAMNRTASGKYSKSSVGINLPIYQGGSGVAYNEMAKNVVESKKYDLKQT